MDTTNAQGFPKPGGSLMDIIYSNGGNLQFDGFTTPDTGYDIKDGIFNRIQDVLNGDANTTGCRKLTDAFNTARNFNPSNMKQSLKGLYGLRTVNTGSPSHNYEKAAFQPVGSGNTFFTLKGSYLGSLRRR